MRLFYTKNVVCTNKIVWDVLTCMYAKVFFAKVSFGWLVLKDFYLFRRSLGGPLVKNYRRFHPNDMWRWLDGRLRMVLLGNSSKFRTLPRGPLDYWLLLDQLAISTAKTMRLCFWGCFLFGNSCGRILCLSKTHTVWGSLYTFLAPLAWLVRSAGHTGYFERCPFVWVQHNWILLWVIGWKELLLG